MNTLSLQQSLGYYFKNPELLDDALRHRSAAKAGHPSYERLEFLGDAVLGLVVADALMRRPGALSEGIMTFTRSVFVCEGSLAKAARRLDLFRYITFGNGTSKIGDRDSVLADTLEAIIGAVFLDSKKSVDIAEDVIMTILPEVYNAPLPKLEDCDCKTAFQQKAQHLLQATPQYETIGVTGPDHNPIFAVRVTVLGRQYGLGEGSSKKRAQEAAARAAMAEIERRV